MSSKTSKEIAQGILLALLVYLTCSTAIPMLLGPTHAQGAPLFSATLIASTGNPVRRQYASIITSNLISLGIDAKLFYVNFDVLANRLFFSSSEQGAVFDKGGYDMGFIGWGFTLPTPDIRANYDGRPAYLAPAGSNYALYNNDELNAIFDKAYTTTDTNKQKELLDKAQEIIFYDKPYNFIYEVIDTVPRDQKWTAWGMKDLYSVVTFPDLQHWGGGKELTMAEASNIFPGNTLNPIATTASNSFYALYIYGAITGPCVTGGTAAALQEVDPRDYSLTPGLAENITTSPDAKDWTITIRKGAQFQSGVEITADDFVWTQWATTYPGSASVGLGNNIMYLGNVVDFTFLNGTTATLDNKASADEPERHGSWKVLDKYTFQFHLPEVYAFTSYTYAAFAPAPKHILEKYAPETWDSIPYSTASEAVTYTWNTNVYGGSGSYKAVGPVGAGPYYMESFDFTRNLATLKKFNNYWNATGLEALGQFTVETYKVVWISEKDAAIAALKNGEVNLLDNNYQLASDKATLEAMGATVCIAPELGWQEQAFNMRHPVFGTGVDTPVGKSDPSKAADAARHVRTAISHLIPREQIVNQLLDGSAYPLASVLGPGWGKWYNANLKLDSYDVNAAAEELRAAGYAVSITPPAKIAYGGTPLFGGSINVHGVGSASRMMVVIERSTDGNTWVPIAATVADNSSRYEVSVPGPPAFGSVYYRANFTGYTLNETLAQMPLTPELVNQYANTEAAFGAVPASVTDPISVSSTTNDALVIVAVIIVIVVISALAARTRKKPAS